MKFIKQYKFLIASIFISFFSVASLLKPGLPPTHDGEFHVLRFEQFFKSINEGTLYPRWAENFNNNYGIPLFNFVYPLPNYVASVTHLLGFSFIDSLKLNMILATLVGSIFFYLWARKYWGDWGGLVSSVFYAYAPYHLLDVFVRGSVGEVWSLGLAPGLFWSYLSFSETKKIKYFVFSSVFLSLIIFSHNILAVVFSSLFIFYAIFLVISYRKNKIKELINVFLISIFGAGLSAIFWLPAILETKYVRGLQIFDPTQHFPAIYKLIYSSWGYGFSGNNIPDQMSFQIGIANVLIVIICSILFVFKKRSGVVAIFLLFLILTVFLITPFSRVIWEIFPVLGYIQFPWRLLSVAVFASSFLSGFIVSKQIIRKEKYVIFVSIILIFLSIGLSIKYLKAPFHHLRDDSYYLQRENFTHGTNSPGNVFNTLNFNAGLRPTNSRILLDGFKIKNESSNVTQEKLFVSGEKQGKMVVNIAYYPGWTIKVDNVPVKTKLTKDGLFEADIPSGNHSVEIVLRSTMVQTISLVITIFSVLSLFSLFMWDKYIKIKE